MFKVVVHVCKLNYLLESCHNVSHISEIEPKPVNEALSEES